ncbi:hypothetical protein [Paenibacillus oleatilyticus]|uniref:hypothetical protein n=1 Tax=Paenibacillus oleatilyticus TaxID=2594886 RepID=UPI001C200C0C|nr:hypothetical protein [Paenibacillus oleatilyticus]MBU7320548.1 hypothetical protein [Paenibacillus oleatilyticus]
MVELFENSGSYAEADARYDILISPQLIDFNESQTIKLLEAIEGNSQIYRRRDFSKTLSEINTHCNRILPSNFDYSPYSKLRR